jgi:hypothetical protein
MGKSKKSEEVAAEVPRGFRRLKAPEGTTSIGHDGGTIDVTDGFVDVPAEIAEALINGHGFTAVE